MIFGASDDLCELRGAIHDEVLAWQGAEIHISKGGQLLATIEEDEADILKKYGVLQAVKDARKSSTKVTANWCKTKISRGRWRPTRRTRHSTSWKILTGFAVASCLI